MKPASLIGLVALMLVGSNLPAHASGLGRSCGLGLGGRGCVRQAGPGPADRQVHPFEGTLGRPCAYRWRPTPSGTRKVRVCF